jgi:hypothetical protein
MKWSDIRKLHPDQWLIVEAQQAHTTGNNQRYLDQLEVISICKNGQDALEQYQEIHRENPDREFYFVHTSRKELVIFERQWMGFRVSHAVHAEE